MKFRFHTLAELEDILQRNSLSPEDYMIKREAYFTDLPEENIIRELDRRIFVTRQSLIKGLEKPQISPTGLTKGAAVSFASSQRCLIDNPLYRKSIAYSLSINEVNACGGKIVAFPTAGSSGIVPGTIWAWWDSTFSENTLIPVLHEPPYDPHLRGAFLTASLVGILIAQGATVAGSEGGCQAECGAAGAMAAGALAYLEKLSLKECFSSAALSLKNSLGLACDPIAGLVEVPCIKRNAFVALNALGAVDLTLAGIESIIPFDEVVLAMKQIGDSLPSCIKETATGGLAITPTGLKFKEILEGLEE